MRESALERYLVLECRKRGWLCAKQTSLVGIPDRLVVAQGRVFFVEVKAESGKLSDVQKAMHKALTGLGAEVHCVYTKQQIDEVLNQCTL